MNFRICKKTDNCYKIQKLITPSKRFWFFPRKSYWVDLGNSYGLYNWELKIYNNRKSAEKAIKKFIENEKLKNTAWVCDGE